jgi:hypothetical protein
VNYRAAHKIAFSTYKDMSMKPWKSAFDLSPEDGPKKETPAIQGSGEDHPQAAGPDQLPDPRLGTWTSPFDVALRAVPHTHENHAQGYFERPGEVIGTPGQDASGFGPQHYQDTCAIRAQEHVIEQFTHQHIDEDVLMHEAQAHGWYAPGQGTPISDLGNLLELHGIPIHRYQDANVIHLAQELAAGHKVIMAVDSKKLLVNSSLLSDVMDWLGLAEADHAIIVTGIDTRDPNDLRVIINDPGTGEAGRSYPLAQFMSAWKDGHFTMVATRDPVPPTAPEMVNFDYRQGLFERVGEALGIHLHHPHYDSGIDSTSPGDANHHHTALGALGLNPMHLGKGNVGLVGGDSRDHGRAHANPLDVEHGGEGLDDQHGNVGDESHPTLDHPDGSEADHHHIDGYDLGTD